MVSLHDAARRLSVPVELLWTWIADGILAAHIKPGRGFGMEYFLDSEQMKSAREVRDRQVVLAVPDASTATEQNFPNGDNIIAFNLGDAKMDAAKPIGEILNADDFQRSSALIAMEKLRNDTLAAVQRQAEREDSLLEMVDAVDMVLTTTLQAIARAQDVSQARLAAELESVRARLATQVSEHEEEDVALKRQLERTKGELLIALKEVDSTPDLSAPSTLAGLEASASASNGSSEDASRTHDG